MFSFPSLGPNNARYGHINAKNKQTENKQKNSHCPKVVQSVHLAVPKGRTDSVYMALTYESHPVIAPRLQWLKDNNDSIHLSSKHCREGYVPCSSPTHAHAHTRAHTHVHTHVHFGQKKKNTTAQLPSYTQPNFLKAFPVCFSKFTFSSSMATGQDKMVLF